MKNFIKSNLTAISTLIGGLLISISIYYSYNLDTLQKISSIFGSFSIAIALATYARNREKDKLNSVIGQISFFRSEALSKEDEFGRMVKASMGEKYIFVRARLDEPTIEFVNKNYRKEAKEQIRLIRELNTLPIQTQLLNILEEFSLRVFYEGTENHEALSALKSPYIHLVELNAVVLLQQKEFFSGKDAYLNVLKLYDLWKNDIDRRSPEERFKEFNASKLK